MTPHLGGRRVGLLVRGQFRLDRRPPGALAGLPIPPRLLGVLGGLGVLRLTPPLAVLPALQG